MITAAVALIASRKSLVTYLFFALLLLVSCFLFLAKNVHADPCDYDPTASEREIIDQFNRCAIDQDIYEDKIFYDNAAFGIVDGLNIQILGISFLHEETNAVTQNRGALAAASTLVAGLYGNPPTSGTEYFAQQIQKFNPIQPVYAQEGEGYKALRPVQKLWTVFRNASYIGFVIVFVIIGFMVMFRAHISPQAVATVQDSIPRIVIALVLVTFSYAIAGLMIDLMFVIINIIINLLAQSGVINAATASNKIFERSIIGVITSAWPDIFTITAKAIKVLLDDVIGSVTVPVAGDILGLLKLGVGGLAGLIVGIAALIIIFRIFVMLLMAYVMIIILTLAAPFFFLIQALPGNNGAKEWFKQMAANIAVFPAVAFMVLLAGAIGGIEAFGGTGAGTLKDIGAESLKFPLLTGGIDSGAIGKIIALGFLFMTPEVANMAKKAFKTEGGPGLGGAGAAALGAGFGIASFPARAAISRYNERRRSEQLRDVLNAPRTPEPGGRQPGEE